MESHTVRNKTDYKEEIGKKQSEDEEDMPPYKKSCLRGIKERWNETRKELRQDEEEECS